MKIRPLGQFFRIVGAVLRFECVGALRSVALNHVSLGYLVSSPPVVPGEIYQDVPDKSGRITPEILGSLQPLVLVLLGVLEGFPQPQRRLVDDAAGFVMLGQGG